MMNWWKKALATAYGHSAEFHRQLFLKGALKKVKVKVPVISVGNLTMGGTGKSPIVCEIAKHYLQQGKKVGVAVRAYKASAVRPIEVDLAYSEAATFFGDEAVQLKKQLPDAVVASGQNKSEIAEFLVRNFDCDLILVDDGFQHHRLHRDFELVLIDASKPLQDLEVVPMGTGRENLTGLHRADWIVLTKVDAKLGAKNHESLLSQFGIPFSRVCFEIEDNLVPLSKYFLSQGNSELEKLSSVRGRALLVAATGNPQQIESSLRETFPLLKVEVLTFPDHHQFSEWDIGEINKQVQEEGFDLILTTEKDAVKLSNFSETMNRVFVLTLKLKWLDPIERIYAEIEKHLR